MKWLWLLVWDPTRALDFRDSRSQGGEIDHGKIMGALAFALFAFLAVRAGELPSLGLTVAFLAAMFGPRMFYRFLGRFEAKATDQTTRTITERRDPALGAEPTP